MPATAVFIPAQLNDLSVDVQLTSVAQGDLLYRGASKWNNLAAPGTTGALLRGGSTPAWAANAVVDANGQLALSATGSSGGVLLGGDVLLYRSVADVLTIPDSLDVKPAGATPTLQCRPGTDPTQTVAIQSDSTSYGCQMLAASGSSETALQVLGQGFAGGAAGEFGVYLGTTGYFRIAQRGASELLRVTRGGNVLLGTTTDPGEKLVVFGAALVGANASLAAQLGVATSASLIAQVIRLAASQTADALQVQNSSGTVLAKVDKDGTITQKGTVAAIVNKTANYTITTADRTITGDATGGVFTVTLPGASSCTGQIFTVKKTDSSANKVTVAAAGTDTIEGLGGSKDLTARWQYLTVQSTGSAWIILASN